MDIVAFSNIDTKNVERPIRSSEKTAVEGLTTPSCSRLKFELATNYQEAICSHFHGPVPNQLVKDGELISSL